MLFLLALIVLGLVLNRMAEAVGSGRNGFLLCLLLGAFGIALHIAAVSAVELYVPTRILRDHSFWMIPTAALICTAAVVGPLFRGVLHSGYLGALLTWVISAASAAVIIVLITTGLDAFDSGRKDAMKLQKRGNEIERVLQ
jgi:hypothetical protein